jgi:cyclopropane fatty-acyl-phospholipid synthase-like methyltransferase
MTRVFSDDGQEHPSLDREQVRAFFEQRALKATELGPTQAVIYQDKHPELAAARDRAEKALLLPLMQLTPQARVLDVGCGTGRWADLVGPASGHYHGIDLSPGLLAVARQRLPGVRFTECPVDGLSLGAIGETRPFSHILSLGVFIYLNDAEWHSALRALLEVAAPACRIVLREPLATGARLTLSGHYSDEMEQTYHATYRNEADFLRTLAAEWEPAGLRLAASGDVYAEAALNNRSDTHQRWFVWERSAG